MLCGGRVQLPAIPAPSKADLRRLYRLLGLELHQTESKHDGN